MKRVWAVWTGEYSYADVIAVCSSRAQADEVAKFYNDFYGSKTKYYNHAQVDEYSMDYFEDGDQPLLPERTI